MVLAVSFEIPGEQTKRFSRAFTRMTEGVQDLSEPFEKIGKDLRTKIIAEQFKSEGAAHGFPWKPLSKAYERRKFRRFGAKPILEATGEMKKALTKKGGDNLSDVRKLWAVFGLRPGAVLRRAHAHQLGNRRLPRREIISLAEVDRKRWGRIIQGYLVKRSREAEKAAGG